MKQILKQSIRWFVVVTAIILILSSTAMMVNAGNGPGGYGGKGGGGGGGAPTSDAGNLFGDLVVLNREEVNGVPIYNPDNGMCEQYITSTGAIVDMEYDPDSSHCSIPEGADTIEVGFGRLNVVRSPSQVLESKFDEAIFGLNTAEKISLDASGRLLLTKRAVGADGVEYTYKKAIDSPGENLALYKKVMSEGHLEGNLGDDLYVFVGDPLAGPLLRPVLNVTHFTEVVDKDVLSWGIWQNLLNGNGNGSTPPNEHDLLFAASFLAAAGDKNRHVTVDMVFHLNSMMGLNTKNASGFYDQTTVVDFSMFDVDRSQRHDKSVYVLVPELNANGAWVNQHWLEAWVELMNASRWTGTYNGSNPEVFIWDTAEGWEYDRDDIGGFAQASDDNQRVLAYTHDHLVPPAPTDSGNGGST
jgi:hypothetical protein